MRSSLSRLSPKPRGRYKQESMRKTRPLAEQVALVTGGGTGIGRAFAEALAAAGVRVVIASRREEVLKRTAGELNLKFGADRVDTHLVDLRGLAQIELL